MIHLDLTWLTEWPYLQLALWLAGGAVALAVALVVATAVRRKGRRENIDAAEGLVDEGRTDDALEICAELLENSRRLRPLELARVKIAEGRSRLLGACASGDYEGGLPRSIEVLDEARRVAESALSRARASGDGALKGIRGSALANLGAAYRMLAGQSDPVGNLGRAAQAYRGALEVQTPESDLSAYGAAQYGLGEVHATLAGVAEPEANVLVAIRAFRSALAAHPPERSPADHARDLAGLGGCFLRMAEIRDKEANLIRAAAAYTDGVDVLTGREDPAVRAAAAVSLGSIYGELAKGADKEAFLRQSAAILKSVLSVYRLETHPVEHAATMNEIGNALRRLFEMTDSEEDITDAVAAFQRALQVYTPEQYPQDRASVLNNIGLAFVCMAGCRDTDENLARAEKAFAEALQVFTPDAYPYHHQETAANLNRARMLIHEMGLMKGEGAAASFETPRLNGAAVLPPVTGPCSETPRSNGAAVLAPRPGPSEEGRRSGVSTRRPLLPPIVEGPAAEEELPAKEKPAAKKKRAAKEKRAAKKKAKPRPIAGAVAGVAPGPSLVLDAAPPAVSVDGQAEAEAPAPSAGAGERAVPRRPIAGPLAGLGAGQSQPAAVSPSGEAAPPVPARQSGPGGAGRTGPASEGATAIMGSLPAGRQGFAGVGAGESQPSGASPREETAAQAGEPGLESGTGGAGRKLPGLESGTGGAGRKQPGEGAAREAEKPARPALSRAPAEPDASSPAPMAGVFAGVGAGMSRPAAASPPPEEAAPAAGAPVETPRLNGAAVLPPVTGSPEEGLGSGVSTRRPLLPPIVEEGAAQADNTVLFSGAPDVTSAEQPVKAEEPPAPPSAGSLTASLLSGEIDDLASWLADTSKKEEKKKKKSKGG